MSQEQQLNLETPDPEADIPTVIPSKADGAKAEWRMPEPVFRQTSGYLPQGFEKRYPVRTADAVPAPPPPPADPFLQTFVGASGMSAEDLKKEAAAARAAAAAEIEPQPEIAEVQVSEEPVEAAPVKKERSRAARFVFAAILIIAAGAFLVVFLAVVYYLFLAPTGDVPPFE